MKIRMATPIDIVIGCTATGKGRVAVSLAERLDAEIISVDSMKVYRGMDIGTAKPSPEVRMRVPHHLIDVAEPSESFSAARFVDMADAAIAQINGRGRRAVAVGGTALYLKALVEGLFEGPSADPQLRDELRRRAASEGVAALHAELARCDPESASRIHPNDMRRIERALEVFRLTGSPISGLQRQWDDPQPRYDCRVIGLRRDKEDAHRRINARVKAMIEAGLVNEVRRLLAGPKPLSTQARQAVGYAEIIDHLAGCMPLEGAVEAIKINTRRLAKHQRTWFRRFRDVRWFDVAADENAETLVERVWSQALAPDDVGPPTGRGTPGCGSGGGEICGRTGRASDDSVQ